MKILLGILLIIFFITLAIHMFKGYKDRQWVRDIFVEYLNKWN
jgi:hypothetical protein